jgi:hypothetical protein
MTATDDLAVLLAALDASEGTDDALLLMAVADELEARGDPRAAGLRRSPEARPRRQDRSENWPVGIACVWGWGVNLHPGPPRYASGLVQPADQARLPPGVLPGLPHLRGYPTRSAAYLGLAEAITPRGFAEGVMALDGHEEAKALLRLLGHA